MNFQKIIVPVLGVVGVVLAYRFYGWAGVAAAATGIVMWVLLHFTRMMTILKRAANRPMGYIDSAVMLNAQLKPGMTLLHVVAMTRSLGALQPLDVPQTVGLKVTEGMIGRQTVKLLHRTMLPEIYRWTDGGQSHVTCSFFDGKLIHHELFRPAETALEAANVSAADPAS